MATLNIASKANQATSLPSLLVATRVNHLDPKANITINVHDTETVKSGSGEAAELTLETTSPVYSTDDVVATLLKTYPFLQGTHEDLVCFGAVLLIT
jgi:glutamyl-tRNA synthetase